MSRALPSTGKQPLASLGIFSVRSDRWSPLLPLSQRMGQIPPVVDQDLQLASPPFVCVSTVAAADAGARLPSRARAGS